MDGCVYRTKDGECDLYSEGGKFHAWCDLDNCDGRKMSNADRIRSMTDEELAKFISGKARGFGEEYEGYMSALDWLKEEATD